MLRCRGELSCENGGNTSLQKKCTTLWAMYNEAAKSAWKLVRQATESQKKKMLTCLNQAQKKTETHFF